MLDLFEALAAYSPTLVGTFPLGIQVRGSDLDVVCEAADLGAFETAMQRYLGSRPYRMTRVEADPEASVFEIADTDPPIEVFAQNLPVTAQRGFRHMVIEGRLLVAGGTALREAVRALKQSGMKTEPAFAALLHLDGDPYRALLELETWPMERITALVRNSHVARG